MVTLQTDYDQFSIVAAKILATSEKSSDLDLEYRKLIAETLLLRLFYELDGCVEEVILKLVRGCAYLDGSHPKLICAPFKSKDAARQHILKKSKSYYLEWTTIGKINKNLNGILDPADHFITTRTVYNGIYEDMRNVRNHVAHNTSSTKQRFSPVVQRIYSSTAGISAAKFLLSPRVAVAGYTGKENILEQYIRWTKVFVKVLIKA